MANNNRPTSPHLQIYKLPLTGIVSISHRITGFLLSVGLIFFVWLVLAISGGEESYAGMQAFMDNMFFRLIYWGFIYALIFHLCHGVRHLIWDAGHGFDRETMDRYVVVELGVSLFLTLSVLIIF
jgi:succinate dehydrogenase / fumarate reductase, cytochrome b subunit